MARADFRNVTVALPPEAWIRLQVLASRLGCASYSKTILRLIDMETEAPHDVQGTDESVG